MTPDLYLRRGLQYTFKIEGGNNAASAEFYHPFIITDEPVGGYNRLTKEQKSKVFFCDYDGCEYDYWCGDEKSHHQHMTVMPWWKERWQWCNTVFSDEFVWKHNDDDNGIDDDNVIDDDSNNRQW